MYIWARLTLGDDCPTLLQLPNQQSSKPLSPQPKPVTSTFRLVSGPFPTLIVRLTFSAYLVAKMKENVQLSWTDLWLIRPQYHIVQRPQNQVNFRSGFPIGLIDNHNVHSPFFTIHWFNVPSLMCKEKVLQKVTCLTNSVTPKREFFLAKL